MPLFPLPSLFYIGIDDSKEKEKPPSKEGPESCSPVHLRLGISDFYSVSISRFGNLLASRMTIWQ